MRFAGYLGASWGRRHEGAGIARWERHAVALQAAGSALRQGMSRKASGRVADADALMGHGPGVTM